MKKFLTVILWFTISPLVGMLPGNTAYFLALPKDLQKVIIINALSNKTSAQTLACINRDIRNLMQDSNFRKQIAYVIMPHISSVDHKHVIAANLGIAHEPAFIHYRAVTENFINLINKLLNKQLIFDANLQQELLTLIHEGADINAYDDLNCCRAPLLRAAFLDHQQLLKFLIKCGADVNRKYGKKQTTALLQTCRVINPQAAEGTLVQLLNAGVDINAQNASGQTVLSSFLDNDLNDKGASIILLVQLLNAGADVNKQDNNKKTALMYLVHPKRQTRQSIKRALAKGLIIAGADLSLQDAQGNTAYTIACQTNPWKTLGTSTYKLLAILDQYPDSNNLNQSKYSCTII